MDFMSNNIMRPANQAVVPVLDARMTLTRSKPGQRKLHINQDAIQKESRLLVKRSKESLKGIVSKALSSEASEQERNNNNGAGDSNNQRTPSIKKRICRSLRTLELLEDHEYIERVYGKRSSGDLLEEDDLLPPEVWEISDYSMSQLTTYDDHHDATTYESEEELILSRSNYDCIQSNVNDDEDCVAVVNDTITTTQNTQNNNNNIQMIEVGPGYELPLRSSNEMWNAILDRKIIKTPCLLCSQQLYCIDDAEILSCSNCNYAFSPILERMNVNDNKHCFGVCVGVTKEDMDEFLS